MRLKVLFFFLILAGSLRADNFLLSTENTSMLLTATVGDKPMYQYYGARISENEIQDIFDSGVAMNKETYPAFGTNKTDNEKAVAVMHNDGNMTLDLFVSNVRRFSDKDGNIVEITMKDSIYPFIIKQFFKAYEGTDVITTWVDIENTGKKSVTLYRFASAFLPLQRGDNWMTHFHGSWAAEHTMEEEKLTNGQKVISNKDGMCNTEQDNPSFLLSMNGRATEESGDVFGGTLAWTGNYLIKVIASNTTLSVSAGINEETSFYKLEREEIFSTPEFCMTYSKCGKGGVSRAFHKWARQYKLWGGDKNRDVLLNSWEGVYFRVNQSGMDNMMKEFSAIGGELFVMDDGWFGNKYPRNNDKSSLGDWQVCMEKLPLGINGLLDSAKKYNIKFGIWIEPESSNTKSELFENKPKWILRVENRPVSTGRGGTQVILDLSNPEVQDFVFGVVDSLMTRNPEIKYMKWDANCSIQDYGSFYLPRDKQSHIYIEYHRGLRKVVERIRAKYPDLVLQACAGGGGRVNYGWLPYFNEFWTSDDTDALQRIYLQWGVSTFYPAVAMASHVSATKNHQTGRQIPLKFRFDVAMSGRLGMEIQPKDMTQVEKAFAKRAIMAYKSVRRIVQFGDLYRLVSPYDNKGLASLMYVNSEESEAVFYAYKTEHFINSIIPVVKLSGLCAEKNYRVKDLTPENEEKPCALDGKVFSGRVLMENGLAMKSLLRKEYSSVALHLEEV